jgi:pimeloyl-ACP methyl ester carboxylesterase
VKKQSHAADALGVTRLAVDAVTGVTELAEALHLTILERAVGSTVASPVALTTRLVYRSVRGVASLVGGGLGLALEKLVPLLGEQTPWRGREALLAALNGVLGDRLAAQGNPLAIPMRFRRGGVPLAPQTMAHAGPRLLVLIHGLCMNDEQWLRQGVDHGAVLERERGYTRVDLHYNTGRHISTNGRELAALLERLAGQWPVPLQEIVIVGHSMGGLVARSACHVAQQQGLGWRRLLSKMVFLGSPHHGAPMERGGNWVHLLTDLSPYSAPFSRLAKIRSAGITDLRHGSVLDEDWEGHDRFAHGHVPKVLPLPKDVQCYAIAATLGKPMGDGLVPLASALGQPGLQFDADQQATVEKTGHLELLNSEEVQRLLLKFL